MTSQALRVWLVDDDASIRWVLERALRNGGMLPKAFDAAEPALEALRSDVPDGRFDRNELIQALLNLARNALQAVGRGGRVVLRTRTLSNLNIGPARHRLVACLQIEDNGPGVPGDLHKTLFFPLVTAKSEGTGLGLSVAQDMVARHGGIIEFESRPGHTVFSMLLPLEDAA